MPYSEFELEEYLDQVRRRAEQREAETEKKIREIYLTLAVGLTAWLGNRYARYAVDDSLTFEILRSKGQYTKFIRDVQHQIDNAYPKLKNDVEIMINTTYKTCWQGMCDGVAKSGKTDDLHKIFKGARTITSEQIEAAVQNAVPRLRLTPILERNRKQIILNIRHEIGIGLTNGDRMSTMAQRISKCVDGDYKKSMLIARTEAHRVRELAFNDSAVHLDKVMRDSGSEYRMVKIWRNMADGAVRKTDKANHVDMEGQTVLANEDFTLVQSGGKTKCPGNSGIAAEDCNCRCFAQRDIISDAEFYAATGRHFPEYEEKVFTNQQKRGIIDNDSVDYMSNSFRPKFSDENVVSVGDMHIPVKRVTNSQFKMYTDVEYTGRNKAVRLTEKNMRTVSEMMDAGFEMPKIVVVDFDKHGINSNAIAGYTKSTKTMFINSKYDTNEKIKAYVNETKGYFSNSTKYAPYLHELGHKRYEDALEAYARNNGITVNRARNIIENRLMDYVGEERKTNELFISKNISKYAEDSYLEHVISEIFAECFSAESKNIHMENILRLLNMRR